MSTVNRFLLSTFVLFLQQAAGWRLSDSVELQEQAAGWRLSDSVELQAGDFRLNGKKCALSSKGLVNEGQAKASVAHCEGGHDVFVKHDKSNEAGIYKMIENKCSDVVRLEGAGPSDDGSTTCPDGMSPCVVLELVEGVSLARLSRMNADEAPGGGLTQKNLFDLGVALLRGQACLHEMTQMYHADLQTENILLQIGAPERRWVIIDLDPRRMCQLGSNKLPQDSTYLKSSATCSTQGGRAVYSRRSTLVKMTSNPDGKVGATYGAEGKDGVCEVLGYSKGGYMRTGSAPWPPRDPKVPVNGGVAAAVDTLRTVFCGSSSSPAIRGYEHVYFYGGPSNYSYTQTEQFYLSKAQVTEGILRVAAKFQYELDLGSVAEFIDTLPWPQYGGIDLKGFMSAFGNDELPKDTNRAWVMLHMIYDDAKAAYIALDASGPPLDKAQAYSNLLSHACGSQVTATPENGDELSLLLNGC